MQPSTVLNKKKSTESLSEVYRSVDTDQSTFWKRLFSFFGPAYLVSVGYMDPGNWATDLAGGSKFGYSLLWVLLMSNIMALLLQSLAARLGLVRGRDLAQANQEEYPKTLNFVLYILAEIAIIATDIAEILGMAIGINLLTGIPIVWGVIITVLDTFLLLYLQKKGMRKMEAFIISLIAVVFIAFLIEIIFAKPVLAEIATGFRPIIVNQEALYIAIGIIGATVMPHNLYLHSALVQTRKVKQNDESIAKAIKYNFIDSAIALNIAFLINASILIISASTFFSKGMTEVASIKDAFTLLEPILGSSLAPILFAIALIACGQSSTITGTLSGQIVMEGYLNLRLNPMFRRLITRLLAIIPSFLIILLKGESELDSLLIFSQVILSLQLAFAIIPLIHFVSDKTKMGNFVISTKIKIFAWIVALVLIGLNLNMIFDESLDLWNETESVFIKSSIILFGIGYIGLLLVVSFYPMYKQSIIRITSSDVDAEKIISPIHHHTKIPLQIEQPLFNRIGIALDFNSENDLKLLSHAIKNGNPETTYYLIHIVESVSAKLLGKNSNDIETISDNTILTKYVGFLNDQSHHAVGCLGFSYYSTRNNEIVHLVNENQCDLLIIGSHRHKWLKDFMYGNTIKTVRHELKIPIYIV